MRFAPIFFFAFGYWMVSSYQLLKNDNLAQIATSDSVPATGHTWNDPFMPQGWFLPAYPMLGMFWFSVFLKLFGALFLKLLALCIPAFEVSKKDTNE